MVFFSLKFILKGIRLWEQVEPAERKNTISKTSVTSRRVRKELDPSSFGIKWLH